jgi:hypothetical protein
MEAQGLLNNALRVGTTVYHLLHAVALRGHFAHARGGEFLTSTSLFDQ